MKAQQHLDLISKARSQIPSRLREYIATEKNIPLITSLMLPEVSPLTVKVAFMDHILLNKDVLIGYQSGSDNYVLGKVVNRTETTYKLENDEVIRWSERKKAYMYKSTRYATLNAEIYLDPNF